MPLYIGMTIFELSKLFMYDLDYNYGSILQRLTACFMKMFTKICLRKMKNQNCFDTCTCDYQKNSKCYREENKKVIGNIKDEAAGVQSSACRSKVQNIFILS